MSSVLANNTYVNHACSAYHSTKQDVDGFKANVVKFGNKLVGVRFEFLKATASTLVDTVYSVATAVFNTLWSLTVGVVFLDKENRHEAIASWGVVVGNLGNVAKSIVGIACPYLVDAFFHEHVEKPVVSL